MRDLLDRINYPQINRFLTYAVYPAGLFGSAFLSLEVGNFHIFPYRILIPVLWLLAIFRVIQNRGVWDLPPLKVKAFGLFLLAWFVYAVLSINWAIDKTNAIRHVIFLFLSFSLILFSVIYLNTIEDLYIVSIIWLVCLGMMIIFGFFESQSGFHLPVSRYHQRSVTFPTAVFYNENDFATFLSLSAPFLLSYFFFVKKFWVRLLFFSAFFALLYVMFATDSRANFLAIILEIGYFIGVFFALESNRKEIMLLLSGSFLAFLIFPNLISDKVHTLVRGFQTIVTQLTTQTMSIGHRINLAKNGLLFLLSTWGFGVGAGNVEYWMQNRAYFAIGHRFNIHNWYLEVLVNYGIFVFVGYVIFYIGLVYKIFTVLKLHKNNQKMKIIGVAILGTMIGFLFASISSSSISAFRPHWMMYALGLSYINIGLNKTQEEGRATQ